MAVKKSVKASAVEKEVEKKKVAAKSTKKTTVKKPAEKKAEVKQQEQQVVQAAAYPNAYVIIDHPCEKENISGNEYVIRIGASMDGYVEISFNDSEWQPCRFASGYWWFDWKYFQPGNIKINARLVSNEGQIVKLSDVRKCKVI